MMLIDVQDTNLNIILNLCLFGILLVTFASLIPWPLRDGRNRWTFFLPVLALALYAVYESGMPTRMDIRLDLIVIWPLLGVNIVATLIRWARIRWRKRNGT